MSVIFGTCLSENVLADEGPLSRLSRMTRHYGVDGTYVSCNKQIGMGFQAFHTHARSRLESYPTTDDLGNMIVLDGRLDNHEDLAALDGDTKECRSDSAL